jgi:uncharacterized membrane protein
VVFTKIGFTREEFLGILFVTFAGSFINIPIKRIATVQRGVEIEEVRVFWLTYRVPHFVQRRTFTTIAVNFGGAIVPVGVSLYLLWTHPGVIEYAIIGTILSSIVIHLVARKVEGIGIVTPAFLPPVAAALFAFLLLPTSPVGAAITAYTSGTLGALIGADLSNLSGIAKLGAPMASIGGAGTFDGIFLTGLIAVLLVSFL